MFEPPYPESLAEDMQAIDYYDKMRQRFSRTAGRNKKLFQITQWAVILGGVVLTGVGAAQTALEESCLLISVLQIVIGLVLGLFVLLGRELGWQRSWLGHRAASEALKHEFFYFLGAVGEYGETTNRKQLLRRRVRAIRQELYRYLEEEEEEEPGEPEGGVQ